MTKMIFSKVMWVGRASVFLVGLAVVLAITVGLASTALAGTGVGAQLNLGKINAVDAATKLAGKVAGSSFQIDNDSTDAGATALELRVEPGKDPMKVNSQAKVDNLNSDKLDGKSSTAFLGVDGKAKDAFNADFASFAGDAQNAQVAADADKLDGKDSTAFFSSADTYFDTADAVTGNGGGSVLVFTGFPCDPEDRILNAGGAANPEDDMIEERPTGAARWLVRLRDNGAPTTSTVAANCLDFPPLR